MLFKKSFAVICHVVARDQFSHFCELVCDRAGLGVERDEHPAQPFFTAHLWQAVGILAERLVLRHGGRAAQTSVQTVGPGVIGAHDRSGVATSVQQRRHAMQTDVRLGPQRSGRIAHHHNRLIGQFAGQVVAGICKAVGASDAKPVFGKDVFQLKLQKRLAVVDLGRHRECLLERSIR